MTARPRIVLASRELFPFGGGGIGTYVALTARLLSEVADVTVLTASWYREKYEELRELGDPRVAYGDAQVAFVEVPEDHEWGGFYSHIHLYSHRLVERMRELFPEGGPELIEFADYLGEGFVATQARRGGDPFFAHTTIAVRLHTSGEMCDVLNGSLARDFHVRVMRELERQALREADVILHAGGDILGTYRRFYDGALTPTTRRVRHPLGAATDGALPGDQIDEATPTAGPLRLLYVGRCERRKGVQDLIAALTGFTAEWHLTVLGRDTDTAPLGRSMRRTLELQVAGDARIAFQADVPRADLPAVMRSFDAIVMPSRWECWPYVALEAMQAGVPVIAPAVGGFLELIEPGTTGWLVERPGVDALMQTLGPLVAEPTRLRTARDPATLRSHVEHLTDDGEIQDAYRAIIAAGPPPIVTDIAPTAADPAPLVSVVIPYYRMHRFVAETVASVFAQTYPRIEVLIVDDGSFDPADVVLAELATRYPLRVIAQANGGLGAARNFGIGQSRGRYVLPLDADNVLEPEFVARCVELLESDDQLAFVSSWNRYVDEAGVPLPAPNDGYRPIGNWTQLVEERNVAGDGTAVLRRRVFDRHAYGEDLTSFEDWALYRELHRASWFGRIIPQQLWRYRVREDSMLRAVGMQREERLHSEMDALMREREVTWVSTNG